MKIILLPKEDIPQKLNKDILKKLNINIKAKVNALYEEGVEEYIIQDGEPYANGELHLGQLEGIIKTSASAEDILHIIMGSFRLHMLQWRITNFSFDVKQKGNKLMTSILTLIKI